MEFVKSIEDLKDKAGDVIAESVEVFTGPDVPFDAESVYGKSNKLKDTLFANLEKAISDGHITTSKRTVTQDIKENDVIVKQYRQTYTKFTAVDSAGVLALPGVDGVAANYFKFVSERADAGQYQPVYVALKNIAAGPAAALKKFEKLTASLSPEQLAAVKAALAGM